MMWTPKFKMGDRVVISFVGLTKFVGAGKVEKVPTEPGGFYMVRYDGEDAAKSAAEEWMHLIS
jgi:hypothetical protein